MKKTSEKKITNLDFYSRIEYKINIFLLYAYDALKDLTIIKNK